MLLLPKFREAPEAELAPFAASRIGGIKSLGSGKVSSISQNSSYVERGRGAGERVLLPTDDSIPANRRPTFVLHSCRKPAGQRIRRLITTEHLAVSKSAKGLACQTEVNDEQSSATQTRRKGKQSRERRNTHAPKSPLTGAEGTDRVIDEGDRNVRTSSGKA